VAVGASEVRDEKRERKREKERERERERENIRAQPSALTWRSRASASTPFVNPRPSLLKALSLCSSSLNFESTDATPSLRTHGPISLNRSLLPPHAFCVGS